jgi:hypothetical protein
VKHDKLVRLSAAARNQAWSQWGAVDDDAIIHLINPMFMGGPAWPNGRQAYKVVRRDEEVLLASDGLSDPFDPELAEDLFDVDPEAPRNGFEYEFYATTTDPMIEIAGSWFFDLVWQISQFAASKDLTGMLDEWTLVSTELYDVDIPEEHTDQFVNEEERVGVLLGLVGSLPPRLSGPLSPIRLVNVKLLTIAELEYAAEHGSAGRQELARRFTTQGGLLTSSLDRPSVI